MSNDSRTPSRNAPGRKPPQRRPYHKPRLTKLGDLRTLTLGGSPGRGESGPNQFIFKP